MRAQHVFLIVIGFVVSGCASVESRWQATRQQNTVGAYRAFIRECPKSEYASSARERIEELRFDEVWQSGATQALEAYLQEYTHGEHASLVRERLEFEQAQNSGTAQSLQKYLRQYPGGRYAVQASDELEELDWTQAKRDDTVRSYDTYLKNHAAGKYVKEARQAREESLWNAAKSQQSIDLFRTYLSDYPDGTHRADAIPQLAELYWNRAEKQKSIVAYRSYIEILPNGPHAAGARDAVEWAQAETKGTREAFEVYLSSHPDGRFTGRARRNIQLLERAIVEDPETIKKIEAGLLFFPAFMKAWWRRQGTSPQLSSTHPLIARVSPTSNGNKLLDLGPTGSFYGNASANLTLETASVVGSTSDLFYSAVSPDNWRIGYGSVQFDGYIVRGSDRAAFSGEITYPAYDKFVLPKGLKCTLNGDSYQFVEGSWRYGLPTPIFADK